MLGKVEWKPVGLRRKVATRRVLDIQHISCTNVAMKDTAFGIQIPQYLKNMSADCIATEIQIPSRRSNNVSNIFCGVGILVKGNPDSDRPKRRLHLPSPSKG